MEGIGKHEESSQVETFISITSASREEALFFLESHNFQLDSAIHSFFENNAPIDDPQGQELGQDFDHREAEEEAEEAAAIPQSSPAHPSIPIFPARSAMSSRDDKKKKASSRPSGGRGGIRTLADLNRQPGTGSDSDDDDAPQEYYTGGEKSGMLVQDPTRGGHDVDAIFDQARQMGATQGPFEQHPSSGTRSFTGTGRLLSGETVPTARPPPPQDVTHNIYFWSNGFTVDDGPLRRFDDPANASFMESIKKSECPKELEPEDRRSTVHVNLIRRGEDYPEPVRRSNPFQGVGRTLGGGSSSTNSAANEPAAVASSPSAAAPPPLAVDESKPLTSIQLRLADGSRTVARFNTDHTVGDIRSFIDHHTASRGRVVPSAYTLQTAGFPPKQLSDTTQTIEQAGLANSVVIQKL